MFNVTTIKEVECKMITEGSACMANVGIRGSYGLIALF